MKLNSHYYIFKKNKILKNPTVRKLRIGVNFLNMMKNVQLLFDINEKYASEKAMKP